MTNESAYDAIILTHPGHLADAKVAAKYQKLDKVHKLTVKAMAAGKPVTYEGAMQALFYCMQCSVTSNGQSMGRRSESEAVARLWMAVHDIVGIDTFSSTDLQGAPILRNEAEVEQWLAS